ncbi:MAG: chemotaxis response regulator protein-glutamate methylesterase [Phycisphaerae bacterium]|jgi:two-component system chemotaxis response regulator CheB|nr:chemotaxis response regulator protein-glutamate methylesterase [Phycisphaerae bacterium]
MAKKIRVMVVDDSMLIRQVLQKELPKDPAIEVVACAADPIEAKPLILQLKPDVLTLDVEMPKMDGITFLSVLQKFYPVPVVMLSTLTSDGSRMAMEALRRGAVEIMQKPGGGSFLALNRVIEELAFKIKAAAVSKHRTVNFVPGPVVENNLGANAAKDILIAIGASTGGTEALRYILSKLPANMPPIVIVQHMPEAFTGPFAATLNSISQLTVQECNSIIDLRPGLALIARGGKHMTVLKKMSGYRALAQQGEPVCHQCPSVEVLFNSVAQTVGPKAIGVMLTGMGNDGASAMLAMRQAGAFNIAQDEESCVVFGMPREAIACNAVQKITPLERIPQALVEAVRSKGG